MTSPAQNTEPEKQPRSTTIPLSIAIAAVACLYFLIPNYRYLSDGLIAAVRMRDTPGWFVHPNHPLHPLLLQIIYRALNLSKSGLDELEVLHLWSIIMGITGCIAFVSAMRTEIKSTFAAMIGLGFYAFTNAIWFFNVAANPQATAVTPQVLALLMIAMLLNRDQFSARHMIALGLVTSIAILSSQLNLVLLAPVAAAVMLTEGPLRGKFISFFIYLLTVLIATLSLYILIAVPFVGIKTPQGFIEWQHSYVYSGRWWATNIPDIIQRNAIGLAKVHIAGAHDPNGIFGNWLNGFPSPLWFISLLVRIGQGYVLIFILVETFRALYLFIKGKIRTPLQWIGLATFLPIFLFSIVWVPETFHYRIMYIPGLILFLLPSITTRYGLDRFNFRKSWPVLLFILFLFSANFVMQILPNADPDNNPYTNDLKTLSNVGDKDLVIFSGTDLGMTRGLYVRYFLGCDIEFSNELLGEIESDPEAVVDELENVKRRGGMILIHKDAISVSDFKEVNSMYGTELDPADLIAFFDKNTVTVGYYNASSYILVIP